MGADHLQAFFSHRVQSLRQWEMTMWMCLGQSCPDCPFSEELGDTEINTWVCGVPSSIVMMAGLPSSCSLGVQPLSKKAHSWSFLSVSSRYAHGVVYRFTLLPFLLFLF
jgi:hypothetical protein